MATFSAGGIMSNIDWTTMIDQLMNLEAKPLDLLKERQSAIRVQVSAMGEIISKVDALNTAATALGRTGPVAVTAVSSNVHFSATTSSGSVSGRYQVQVDTLAMAAKGRSDAFSDTDTLAGGTLIVKSGGTEYSITLEDGQSLADVASAIRRSGAPVTATVLDDGTNQTLSLANRDTGYAVGSDPAEALTLTHLSSGNGKDLGFTLTQSAVNAVVKVDGVALTRTSNVISDAVSGVTLTLKSTGAAEDLVLENDVSGTAANVQKFVDAYNAMLKLVQKHLQVDEGTDRNTTLAGESSVRSLQNAAQRILTSSVADAGNDVRSLADIGIKTARDGSISLDQTMLTKAMARSTTAVNALFTDANTGLAAMAANLAKAYSSSTGMLSSRQTGLNRTISDMDDQAASIQLRLDNHKRMLVAQFTAMENTIAALKATANFLDSQSKSSSSS